MASFVTRAERAGNIFFRVTGLIRSGQMKWADRPLWYDVYVGHPPLTAPDWGVKLPKYDEPVRHIFYEEDNIRARFYKKYRSMGWIWVERSDESISQKFINEYHAARQESPTATEDEIFSQTEQRMETLGVRLRGTRAPPTPPSTAKEGPADSQAN